MKTPAPVLGKYTVRRPNKADLHFDTNVQAAQFLAETPGFAKLYGMDGELMLTKGEPQPDA